MTPSIKQRIEQIRLGEIPKGYVKTRVGVLPIQWETRALSSYLSESFVIGNTGNVAKKITVKLWNKGVVAKKEIHRGSENTRYYKRKKGQLIYSKLDFLNCAFGIIPESLDGFESTQDLPAFDIEGVDPVFEEQRKITAILTAQDKVIELKERLLAEKQRQKKYLMQQLLTGKKRLPGFSGEWKNIKLCEVLSERKEKNVEQNLRICSVAVQKGVVDQVEHLGRSYAANDTSNYSVAHYGDIIYTKSPTGDFLYGIVKQNLLQETVAVSPLYGVFTPLTFGLGCFLHTYFQSAICARNYLLPIVQKGAKNTINITNDTFISSKLYLPLDVEEQKAIADTFIAADREIDLLRQDIEQEKQKKKALMHLLLTGIVRVKVCSNG